MTSRLNSTGPFQTEGGLGFLAPNSVTVNWGLLPSTQPRPINRRHTKAPPPTFPVEALVEDLLHGVLGGLERVLAPRLAVIRAKDDNLAFLAAERGEVRHLQDHGAEDIKTE